MMTSKSIRFSVNGTIHSFLGLSNIQLRNMCHILFIHSSVDGHLSCSHVLAIVNSAAINIGVYVSFGIMMFSGYMPRKKS